MNNNPHEGQPNRALCLVIDSDNFRTLAWTGTYFHAEIECNGVDGEELGLERDPHMDPGYYVYEGTNIWQDHDRETGLPDDFGLNGSFRPATLEDFKHFNVFLPFELPEATKELADHQLRTHIEALKGTRDLMQGTILELVETLHLFREFTIRNATQWSMGSNHHHPVWTHVANTLGPYVLPSVNHGYRYQFIRSENQRSLDSLKWEEERRVKNDLPATGSGLDLIINPVNAED